MKLIFDTNTFDDLINGTLNIETIIKNDFQVFLTHIQIDELNECPDNERRARLFNSMIEIKPTKIPTESFIIGVSRIGSAKLSDGNLFNELRNGNIKNTNDALIGETAIKNNLILVTNDIKFSRKVIKLGGKVMTTQELLY